MPDIRLRGRVYYSDIYIGGKRIRRPLDTDKRFALKKLEKLMGLSDAERFGRAPVNVAWDTFRDKFLNTKTAQAKNTKEQYLRAISNLEDHQTPKSPSDVSPSLLADLKASWKEKGRGLYVINRDIQSIKAMMRTAESWGYVEKQDWSSVKRDKEPKGRLLWYTVKDLRRLRSVCRGSWRTVLMLGARAGLRRSEIHWLSWQDVDLERNRVHVSPKPGWNPKDHERRWIPMSADLRAYLKGLRRHSEWVMDEGEGRTTPGSMTIYFSRLVRKAGLKGSIHTLRHTFGSHLASAGVSPYIIQKLMGHSKVTMTDRYMHLAPDAQAGAIEGLPPL